MSAAPQLAQFQMIDTSKIDESPLNPRKAFDEVKLAELTASVRVKGVLEPILVRPVGKRYEVAAGARRFRAAVAAELAQVPAMVREMTDTELLEVALLENVVRADISALEEGDTYAQLVKEHGYSVEHLVEKTGKSRTVVFQRMKLAELAGPIRARLEAGHLQASVAELLARLPTQPMREAALKALQDKAHWRGKDGEDLSGIPFKEAREILDAEFRLVLKAATFDVKDAELVATAGACTACPKRTAADKELFPGIKEDHCLDSACWKSKEKASFAALKAEAKSAGKDLVKVGDLYDRYDSSKLAGSVRSKFDKPGAEVTGDKTWKQLLGAEVPTVTVMDGKGKTLNLVDKTKALSLLEQKDPKLAEKVKKAAEKPEADDWQARAKKEQEKRERERLVSRLVRAEVEKKVTKPEAALQVLLLSWASDEYEWPLRLERAGVAKKTQPEKLKPAELARMLVLGAFSFARMGDGDFLTPTAKLAKLDLKALQKKVDEGQKGTCVLCGCTEEKSCKGDCEWVDGSQMLCSKCDEED